mmetsp:Transcript_21257/g.42141  ORF Transcript_21257/g.42141 Transcript_21257/m.42141 type:complete len:224 (-) Transcript_21257:260-931(-)
MLALLATMMTTTRRTTVAAAATSVLAASAAEPWAERRGLPRRPTRRLGAASKAPRQRKVPTGATHTNPSTASSRLTTRRSKQRSTPKSRGREPEEWRTTNRHETALQGQLQQWKVGDCPCQAGTDNFPTKPPNPPTTARGPTPPVAKLLALGLLGLLAPGLLLALFAPNSPHLQQRQQQQQQQQHSQHGPSLLLLFYLLLLLPLRLLFFRLLPLCPWSGEDGS